MAQGVLDAVLSTRDVDDDFVGVLDQELLGLELFTNLSRSWLRLPRHHPGDPLCDLLIRRGSRAAWCEGPGRSASRLT